MSSKKIDDVCLPSLYQVADRAAIKARSAYYLALQSYLFLLIIAAIISFYFSYGSIGIAISVILFLSSLGILIWLRVKAPDDVWYKARALAESVRSMSWCWMMNVEPYDSESSEETHKLFLSNLKEKLETNKSLSTYLHSKQSTSESVSKAMYLVRDLPFYERLNVYKQERIDVQIGWFQKKIEYNKYKSKLWFVISIILHLVTICMLLYRINQPSMPLPIEIMATVASAALTWSQAKKNNELNSLYALALQEIILITSEADLVSSEESFSNFVLNTELVLFKEHTRWLVR